MQCIPQECFQELQKPVRFWDGDPGEFAEDDLDSRPATSQLQHNGRSFRGCVIAPSGRLLVASTSPAGEVGRTIVIQFKSTVLGNIGRLTIISLRPSDG